METNNASEARVELFKDRLVKGVYKEGYISDNSPEFSEDSFLDNFKKLVSADIANVLNFSKAEK